MSEAKKFKKRYVIIPLVLIVAIAIAVTVFIYAPGNISRQEAMDIAVAHIGTGTGMAGSAERDFEHFQRAWGVEVLYDNRTHNVYVNINTGAIISVEWD